MKCRSRRPLRFCLFETLLFVTLVTFALQIGYVFIPVFMSHQAPPTPMVDDGADDDYGNQEPLKQPNEKSPLVQKVNEEKPIKLQEKPHQEPANKRSGKEQKIAHLDEQKNAPQIKQKRASQNKPKKATPNQPNKPPQNLPIKAPQNQPNKPPQNQPNKALQNKPNESPQKQPNKLTQTQPTHQTQPTKSSQKVDPNRLITVDNKNNCVKKILILGSMKVVEQWHELEDLVRIMKQYPSENNVTYRMPLECPSCTIELTFSSNYTGQMVDKDAVILGVAPYTLVNNIGSLLQEGHPHDQIWMLYGVETALRIHKWIKNIGSLDIHGMWSYLSTSAIHMPYAYYAPGTPSMNAKRMLNKYWIKSKTKLIGWMGSNCAKEVFWPRMDFITDLQKHVAVDTYGKCGNLTCLPRLSEECKNLMTKYKFYLSVENAECNEYITEKFWDTALQHGVVPIVYGARREDYERLAPPNSFIYVGDFNSTKDLAEYIKKLDRRPDLYAKYFEWRYKGSVKQVYPNLDLDRFCDVVPFIDQLQKGNLEKKPVSTFPWYNSCRNPITKPFNLKKDVPPLQDWKPW